MKVLEKLLMIKLLLGRVHESHGSMQSQPQQHPELTRSTLNGLLKQSCWLLSSPPNYTKEQDGDVYKLQVMYKFGSTMTLLHVFTAN